MRQTNRPLSMQFSEFHNEVELNDVVIQQKELSDLQRNVQLAWLCSGKEDTDRKSMEQSKMNSKDRNHFTIVVCILWKWELLYFDSNSEVFLETCCFQENYIIKETA